MTTNATTRRRRNKAETEVANGPTPKDFNAAIKRLLENVFLKKKEEDVTSTAAVMFATARDLLDLDDDDDIEFDALVNITQRIYKMLADVDELKERRMLVSDNAMFRTIGAMAHKARIANGPDMKSARDEISEVLKTAYGAPSNALGNPDSEIVKAHINGGFDAEDICGGWLKNKAKDTKAWVRNTSKLIDTLAAAKLAAGADEEQIDDLKAQIMADVKALAGL